MDFTVTAASLSTLPVVEIPSVISAGGDEESSGSNTATVRLLLGLLTHSEQDGLCRLIQSYSALPPSAQIVPVSGKPN